MINNHSCVRGYEKCRKNLVKFPLFSLMLYLKKKQICIFVQFDLPFGQFLVSCKYISDDGIVVIGICGYRSTVYTRNENIYTFLYFTFLSVCIFLSCSFGSAFLHDNDFGRNQIRLRQSVRVLVPFRITCIIVSICHAAVDELLSCWAEASVCCFRRLQCGSDRA